ncbi:MAG: PhnD/SsuA/transferrin family substrate-binding protein, partial [Ilumatobacter sp.]
MNDRVPLVAGLPMYDWPEVESDVDRLWSTIAAAARERGVLAPDRLTRTDSLVDLWGDPTMILGQVCSLNPVRDGLGETEVVGTIVYEPPPGLPDTDPGTYYSVLIARTDDERRSGLGPDGVGSSVADESIQRFDGCTIASNGTDSQSGYWSLGHFVRDRLDDGPIFGEPVFTGAHRESVRAVAGGRADLAAIDVHSWRLALEHEPASAGLSVIGTTEPTPGVVCVVSWELGHHRAALDA